MGRMAKQITIKIKVNEKLSEMLLKAKEASGETQLNLAKACNISRQCYADWENGIRTPSVENCERLAEALKIDLEALLEVTHPDVLKVAKKLGKS
jgi:transcriptional regulator with XRE-family HTH domain